MPSPVTNAMIESYALMVLVMGTFFLYFCGMVWAFCNPKLSSTEEGDRDAEEDKDQGDRYHGDRDLGDQSPPDTRFPLPPYTETYVNFWDDTDSLITDCGVFFSEEQGINNLVIDAHGDCLHRTHVGLMEVE